MAVALLTEWLLSILEGRGSDPAAVVGSRHC